MEDQELHGKADISIRDYNYKVIDSLRKDRASPCTHATVHYYCNFEHAEAPINAAKVQLVASKYNQEISRRSSGQ